MTTGYLAAGACWPTANEAIDAYYTMAPVYPYLSGGILYTSQPIKVSGVWKYNQSASNTTATTVLNNTLPTNVYGTCTIETAPHYFPPYPTGTGTGTGGTSTGTVTINYPTVTYDYAAAMAAWSFAFITVMGFWLMAKNLGIVINAIKRW